MATVLCISATYLSPLRHEQGCTMLALLLQFSCILQLTTLHNEATILNSMCKSVAKQKVKSHMWWTSLILHSGWLVEIMRSLCSLSQTRMQNTEHRDHGTTLKINYNLQYAIASVWCFTQQNSRCTWWPEILGIKNNQETWAVPFGMLWNRPAHKAC